MLQFWAGPRRGCRPQPPPPSSLPSLPPRGFQGGVTWRGTRSAPTTPPPHRGRVGAHRQPGPTPYPHPLHPGRPRSAPPPPTPSWSHETHGRASQLRTSAHSSTSPAPRQDPLPPHSRVTTPSVSVALFLLQPHDEPPPSPSAWRPSLPLSVVSRGPPFPGLFPPRPPPLGGPGESRTPPRPCMRCSPQWPTKR